jgi:hypothetical protein
MNIEIKHWYWVAAALPLVSALCYLVLLFSSYHSLPRVVPVHFDFSGIADNWMNKQAWGIVSAMAAVLMVALVFTTRPSPLDLSTILYWFAFGLLIGSFFQITQTALNNIPFHFWPLLYWAIGMPLAQYAVSLAFKPWWKH